MHPLTHPPPPSSTIDNFLVSKVLRFIPFFFLLLLRATGSLNMPKHTKEVERKPPTRSTTAIRKLLLQSALETDFALNPATVRNVSCWESKGLKTGQTGFTGAKVRWVAWKLINEPSTMTTWVNIQRNDIADKNK